MCSIAKAQEARELIKSREFNLYVSCHRLSHPLHQKSGLKPGEPGKPWLNQTYQAFDNIN